MHRTCLQYIKAAAAGATTDKVLVATHHVPTFMNYPDEYRGSDLNEAFATELFDYIEGCPISTWVFGHHHRNVDAFCIGNTRLVTNQLGYLRFGENEGFRGGAMVD